MPEPRRSRMNAHSSRQKVRSDSHVSSSPPESSSAAQNSRVAGLAPATRPTRVRGPARRGSGPASLCTLASI